MYRFLLSLSALAVFIASPQSWGLGLGEIELDSALNQKFSATIELFDTSGLEPGEIIVSLGSSDDFKRVGVERFFLLTDLQFDVTYGPTGKARIQVSSSRAVTEPYLNFLVEVLWPSGRMLKEYTVLLDPPTFREAAAPAVMAPRQGRDSATSGGRVRRVEPANTGAQAQSGTQVQIAPRTQTEPSALDQGLSGEEYGVTDRDDTLWAIASRVRRANGASIQQTMLAIQELNPEAFINGNINLLKAGYVLRLPDEKQARALSNSDALAAVARHEEAWRAYNRGDRTRLVSKDTSVAGTGGGGDTSELRSPVDATAASESAAPQTVTEGELRIVAEAGDSTTGVGGADL
ncbi:MAG: FimV family protein, partial [Pseudomonadales bacterium]